MKSYKVFTILEFFVFIFLFCSSLFLVLFYLNEISSSLNYKGIKSLSKKDFMQAQKHFTQALEKKPYDSWSYLNLALSYDLSKNPNQALQNYEIVSSYLEKKSNSSVFYSYFNQGELYGRLNQLKKSLKNYQQALNFQYKEKEIKKNIELLFQDDQKQKNQDNQKQKKNQNDKNQENSNKDNKESENQENQDQDQDQDQDQNQENQDQDQDQDQDQNQENSNEDSKGLENKKQDSPSNELSEKEQSAILEEIEKQENKTREKLFQKNKVFGDKSQKDW